MFSIQILLNIDDDTLYQSILYFDKYISLKWKTIAVPTLHKIAFTCLVLSSKINEIYYIKLHKLNSLSKQTVSPLEYVEIETDILTLFDFYLPHSTIHELFKLYEVMFKLQGVIKKDAINFVLKKCILDYDLIGCGVEAIALAALSYLCRLKRVMVNTVELMEMCKEYPKALVRIDGLIREAKRCRQTLNPETQEYIQI